MSRKGRGIQPSTAATACQGCGNSASSAKTAPERASTRSAGSPKFNTVKMVVGPNFGSGELIPCRASSPAAIADSEATKRSRSRLSDCIARNGHRRRPPAGRRVLYGCSPSTGCEPGAARFNWDDERVSRLLYWTNDEFPSADPPPHPFPDSPAARRALLSRRR